MVILRFSSRSLNL